MSKYNCYIDKIFSFNEKIIKFYKYEFYYNDCYHYHYHNESDINRILQNKCIEKMQKSCTEETYKKMYNVFINPGFIEEFVYIICGGKIKIISVKDFLDNKFICIEYLEIDNKNIHERWTFGKDFFTMMMPNSGCYLDIE
jgi:hypothetical protein